MTRVKSFLLLVFAALFALSACNLPVQGTPSTVLTVRVNAATEYRTGPGQEYSVVGAPTAIPGPTRVRRATPVGAPTPVDGPPPVGGPTAAK